MSQTQNSGEPATASSSNPAVNLAVLAVLRAIATILAVRFLLLLSMIGGYSLAIMAMQEESYHGLFVFISYSLLAVAPIVWLDRSERRKAG